MRVCNISIGVYSYVNVVLIMKHKDITVIIYNQLIKPSYIKVS